jgi:hypothetical protein
MIASNEQGSANSKRIVRKRMSKSVFVFVCLLLAIFLLSISLADSLLWAAQGIVSKNSDPSGRFCHLKFPAIREDTLFTDRPILKDPSDGDIVDFYGPCDHDPLGREEILRQRADLRRERRRYSRD